MFTLFTCLEFLMYFRYECFIRNKFYKYIFLSGLLCRLFVFLFCFVLRGRTERELIFNLFPKCLQSWYWSVLNQGAGNSIQVSHLGSRWPNYLNYHLYQCLFKSAYLFIFIWKAERQTQRLNFCLLVAGNNQGWARFLELNLALPAGWQGFSLNQYPLPSRVSINRRLQLGAEPGQNPPGTSIWAFRHPTLCPNRYVKCTPRQRLLKGIKSLSPGVGLVA